MFLRKDLKNKRYKNAEILAKNSISIPIDPKSLKKKLNFIVKTLNEFNDEKVIILKNDAVGDLTQSLKAINNIINSVTKTIEIYLSERSEKFNFFFR